MRFGDLRRLTPINRNFGFDRGLPIDRHYIEQFLSTYSSDIRGHVLEIEDDFYTRKFGGNRVTKSDVLHAVEGNRKATIVADLTRADNIQSDTFDSIIFTQTLECIYDVKATLRHLYRILKPGGVLLATTSGLNKISCRIGIDPWGEYWRFTTQSAQRLFQEYFPAANITVKSYGNVFAAVAFLEGLATEELGEGEVDYFDPDYEVLITVRAVKPKTSG